MKFVSAKKVGDHAYRLHEIRQERAELTEKLRALKEEQESIEKFLNIRIGEDFQFSDSEGYLMEADFVPWSRQDINGDAVRRFYAKMGKKVPMNVSEGIHIKVKYVLE